MNNLKTKKKVLIAILSIVLFILLGANFLPCTTKASVTELLWQRTLEGCRLNHTNEGMNSLEVYKNRLFLGTYNPSNGGEIWNFDGRNWSSVVVIEIPFSELPLFQRILITLKENNARVIVSSVAIASIANIIGIIPATAFLPYLLYIFQMVTEPFLFFSKKKRKWGIVYDSFTKQPLDLAIVRLFDKETKKIVETRVTNLEGKYLFVTEFGKQYFITVTKPGYDFPSKVLATEIRDKEYDQLYHGEAFNGTEESKDLGFIAYNIPIDQIAGQVSSPGFKKPFKTTINTISDLEKASAERLRKERKKIIRANRLRTLSNWVAYIGPVMALTSFILTPRLLTYLFLMMHVVLIMLFKRLAKAKIMKPWGKVFELKSLVTLPQTLVRLFDTKYGRLLNVYITKGDGQYGFMVGEGEKYSMMTYKEGYIFPEGKAEVVYKQKIKKDLGMQKVNK